jgi:hypothetical protein
MKPKKSIFGAGTVVSIFIVAILISSAIAVPVFNNDNTTGIESTGIETNDEKELDVFTPPDYYDITIWKIRPTSYEEEVKRVSYDEAMEIKAAYEQIESSNDDFLEQSKQKNAVLRNYGVLSSDDTLENYEKEFSEWKKTQNMNQLWEIVDFFLKIFEFLDVWGVDVCLVFFGCITGYLHGPFDEDNSICIGIPIPYTALVYHSIFGQGPAEGTSISFLGMFSTLLLGMCHYVEETTAEVLLGLISGFGYISYLPFLLNMDNEGRFDFTVFCMCGGMGTFEPMSNC